MIRLLQKDNRTVKVLFTVIIGAAILSMIVYLVPGLYDSTGMGTDVFATVRRPGLFNRIFGDSAEIRTTDVARITQSLMQQRGYPAFYQMFVERQAQQMEIAWAIENQEAKRLGLTATDKDVSTYLHQGQLGSILFPGGKFIGADQYKTFVQNALGMPTTAAFEEDLRKEIERQRLRDYVTAGVTVSDNAVRDTYLEQGTKVKFQYASINTEDVSKDIAVTDSELETYFNTNKARYANAVPESRKLSYIVVTSDALGANKPQVTDADVQAFYNQHLNDYKVEDQVKIRHILISVPNGANPQTDAAAKAKAQDVLNKVNAGGNFADLAKQNSDDPGSKVSGGELGWVKKNGQMVPEFESAAMGLQKGQTSGLVKTQFGYHILQAEDRQSAHTRTFDEVKGEIRPVLEQQKSQAAMANLSAQLTSEASKSGLAATAAAHHLQVQTSDYVAQGGVLNGVADSTALLGAAFNAKKGDAPKVVSTGDAVAVFQVDDIRPAHAPAFAEWKDKVATDYKQQQVPAMLQARLTKLAARANELHDLKKAADELHATVKTSDLVGREATVADLGQVGGTAAAAFTLPVNGISPPIQTQTGGAVLQVLEKQQPEPAEIASNFDKTRTALLSQKQDEAFSLYMQTLMDDYQKRGGIHLNTPRQQQGARPGAAGANPLGM